MPTRKLVQIMPEQMELRSSYDVLRAQDPGLSEAEFAVRLGVNEVDLVSALMSRGASRLLPD
jgi:putative heme degradation protein